MVSVATIHSQSVDQERAERRLHVDNALASVRLEGLEPTEPAKAIFARYIAGEISADDLNSEIQTSNAREFGSVPVSGD
jgi:hypothetical protein